MNYRWSFWGLGTHSGSCPRVPLPQENALVQEPRLQQDVTHLSSFRTYGIIAGVGGHGHRWMCVHLGWMKVPVFGSKVQFQSA